MANILKHKFVSAKTQSPDATIVSKNEWNDEHSFSGGTDGYGIVYKDSETDNAVWFAPAMQNVKAPPYNAVGNGSTDDRAAVNSAVGVGGAVFFPDGTYLINSNLTIPSTATLLFSAGAKLSIPTGVIVTINGEILNRFSQIFTLAGTGAVRLPYASAIYSRWFGADPTFVNDSSTAIQAAVNTAITSGLTETNTPIILGAGRFKLATTVTITAAGNGGVNIVGVPYASHQQGSVGPTCRLRWTGGVSPMFTTDESYTGFYNFAADNFGTAEQFLKVTSGAGRINMHHMSFVIPGGGTRFSEAVVFCAAGGGYCKFEDIEYAGASSKGFFELAAGNFTTIEINGGVFDTAGIDTTVLLIGSGTTADIISVHNATFNSQLTEEMTLIDCTSIGTGTISVLSVRDVEFAVGATPAATDRYMVLRNCRNVIIDGVDIEGGGVLTAAFSATASSAATSTHVHVKSCHAVSLPGPIVETNDTNSRVFGDNCNLDVNNTRGVTNPTVTPSGIVEVTYANPTVLLGHLGNPFGESVHRVIVTNGSAFTMNFATATGTPWGYMTRGQLITVVLSNTSGGAMGVVTWDAAQFKLGGAFTNPATGFERSITFYFDGAFLKEKYRGTTDVAN